MTVCSWCGTDAEAAAKVHEGPHSTSCLYYKPPRWRLVPGRAYTFDELRELGDPFRDQLEVAPPPSSRTYRD